VIHRHPCIVKAIPLLFALLACAPLLHAETPATKTQNLTAPGQVPEGLAKSDWSSIRAAYEAGRHAFQPIGGGWQARNPGQQWTTKFDGRGFLAQPKGAEWQWGLELRSYGFPGAERAVDGVPAVKAEGQRLSYQWDATVQEWWVNDTRGLEHGFTVKARPAGAADAALQFVLAVRGSLTPKISDDAKGVLFQNESGVTVLNYSGLKVWDADGKVLASRFAPLQPSTLNSQPSVRLLVEERGARYPLTIDPIAQQAYLKAGNNGPAPSDQFGRSVAVAGDTVVVGAWGEDSNSTGVNSTPDDAAPDAGAAYVFVRSAGVWTQEAYLKPAAAGTSQAGDLFGISVAVAGDTVVVGANNEDSSTTGVQAGAGTTFNESASDAGAAYVFVRSAGVWTQEAYLKPAAVGTTQVNDRFGYSVAVAGDTVVVGALNEDSSTTGVQAGAGTPNDGATAPDAGAAYVFVRSGTTWSQQAYLKPAAVGTWQSSDQFGISVAVSGDTVVVGAIGEDSSTLGVQAGAGTPNDVSNHDAGAAYVFARNGTTWSQQAYLKPAAVGTTQARDNFGWSVAVAGDTVVVGAIAEDSSTLGVQAGASTPNESASAAGAAYVFVRSAGVWTQQAYLKPAAVGTSQAGDQFGYSVAVSGNTVVVGAPNEDSSTTGVQAGAGTPNESVTNAGAAYVFVRGAGVWSQQAYLKPAAVGTTQFGDGFGLSVAVAGDTVVVGAWGEDSSTTGVQAGAGAPNDALGASGNSGAAGIFVRSGTTWSQEAYAKASNAPTGTGYLDDFGYSVAVSGNTVVVGAPNEDSSTTGVQAGAGATFDESATNAGAAYVFVRSDGVWTQQAYLKPAAVGTSQAGDQFGRSVAVADDTVVVGATHEDSSTTGVQAGAGSPNESSSNAGAAYVFVRSDGVWTQQAYLKPAAVDVFQGGDLFGSSVAVSGDTVVVGAILEDSSTLGVQAGAGTPNASASDAGAACVFVRSGTTWSQQAYLKPAAVGTSQVNDQFGRSVAVAGDTVVVGAAHEDSSTLGVQAGAGTPDDEYNHDAGAAYVFVRSGTTWSQQAYLKPAAVGTSQAGDLFGISVAVSGDTVVVGAAGEDSGTTGVQAGAGTIFNESATNAGAAYVFVRSAGVWTQQAYLKPAAVGTSQAGDLFGISVALAGDTVVVGANDEDSSTLGVQAGAGTPNEVSDHDAGAAYVFVRSGTTWSQQAYLKPAAVGTTQAGDQFGYSVAVSGDTVVVGANYEDSSTTGVQAGAGTIFNESASSGAAYIFTLAGAVPDIAVAEVGSVADGGSVACGTVTVGSSGVPLTFTITNPGTADLTGLAFSPVDGANPSDFTVSALSGTTVPASGGSVTFTVTFTPGASGARSAAIHITSNVTGSKYPYDITLTGSGNTAPTFTGYSVSTPYQTAAGISLGNLLTQAADADADPVTATAAGPVSAQGGTAVLQAGSILYTPPTAFSGTDSFPVTITDAPGASVNGTVTVTVGPNPNSGEQANNTPQLTMLPGGDIGIAFQGISGHSYQVQRSTDLTNWTTLATVVAAANGSVNHTDEDPPPGNAFYRFSGQ
jgi:hypothetical protein